MCDNWLNHYEQTGRDTLYPWEANGHEYLEIDSECKEVLCQGRMRRCQNWEFCQQEHPGVILSCWSGFCLTCSMITGTLKFKSNEFECPVCYDVHTKSVCYPSCNHEFCVDCLRTMLFGSYDQLANIREVIDEVCNSCESCCHECDEVPDCEECNIQCDHDREDMAREYESTLPLVLKCPFCRVDSGISK